MSLDVDCDVCRLRFQPPARVLTATALLGTRRAVLPNSVLNFTHCRIVLIVRCRSYQELENWGINPP